MGYLINREELIERIEEQYPVDSNNHVINDVVSDIIFNIIDEQPIAYDVDKVVDELEGLSGIQFDGKNESYELDWCISTERAIEIVKGGGVDE